MELKITSHGIFFKGGSFGAAHVGKVERTNVYFGKGGSFGAVQGEKVESLGAAQAEKWGLSGSIYPYCPNMGVPIPDPTPG